MSLSLCRLCLKLDTNITRNIFLIQPYSQQISEMIRDLTQLHVSETDPLSKLICDMCHKKLIRACKFRSLVINSDWKFRQKYCLLTDDPPQNHNNNQIQITVKTEYIAKAYKCAICDCCYQSEDELLSHELEMHSNLEAKSDDDNNLIKTEQDDDDDISDIIKDENAPLFDEQDEAEEQPQQIHKCRVCNEEFPSKPDLDGHGVEQHRDLTCAICKKIHTKPYFLKRHQKIHDRDQMIKCELCFKYLSSKLSFKNHLLIHNNLKPYVCEICGKGFRQSYSVIIHSRMHTGEKPFHCQKCDLRYAYRNGYFQHMARHHPDELKSKKKKKRT